MPHQGQNKYYKCLMPDLQLYLSNNLLDHAPGEIYHLENLTVLSLRSNNISEIMPSISKLVRLCEINLGCNQLKWLPWELLSLFNYDLQKCTFHPNPFLRLIPSMWDLVRQADFRDWSIKYMACTETAFLDINGSSHRNYPPAPSSIPEHWPEASSDGDAVRPPPEECLRIPSLLELSIRACYKAPQLSQLPFLLPEDCPCHLRRLLESTWRLKEAGGKECSVCKKEYIIPRTEWIEWWYCLPGGAKVKNRSDVSMPVPFLRRGCSWKCTVKVPEHVHIRGWSSATEPGGLKEEVQLEKHSRTGST